MEPKLDRRAVVGLLLAKRGEAVVIGGLGATAWDITAAGDDPRNVPLWGAMGGAALMGLGLALARPDLPVVVVTGDGEMLMGMGGLASIGLHTPKNLTIVVLDNEAYGETGGQPTHTAGKTDLAAVARACGISDAHTLTTMHEVAALAPRLGRVGEGMTFAVIKIDAGEAPKVLPPRDGVVLMARTRGALGYAPL